MSKLSSFCDLEIEKYNKLVGSKAQPMDYEKRRYAIARAAKVMEEALKSADSNFSLLYHRYRKPMPTEIDMEVNESIGKVRRALINVEKILNEN